ncbi:hypothetical protein QQX98_012573 [Neonectria punicea]|uniref:NACHT domain-containing protein n=1 Tax=Neonectria punicea TaxID=979145 RepID=A0ABR1GIM7_9HYPO
MIDHLCKLQDRNHDTPANFIGSLLRQLIPQLLDLSKERDFSEKVKDLHAKYQNGRASPALSESFEILQSEIGRFSNVFIVVDALDECSRDDWVQNQVNTKLQVLRGIVNLMVTSHTLKPPETNDPAIETKQRTIEPNEDVVRCFIDECFKRGISKFPEVSKEIKGNLKLSGEIRDNVVKKARGLLLFAKFDMGSLRRKTTSAAILEAAKQPQAGLGEKYENAVERIQENDSDSSRMGQEILSWLSCAFRHLTVNELQDALAMEGTATDLKGRRPNEGVLEDVCDGLVVVDPGSKQIRLFHDTAYDYFREHPIIDECDAHRKMTITCLRYASLEEFASGCCNTDEDMNKRLDNYQYAAQHWGYHASHGGTDKEVDRLAVGCLQSPSQLASFSQAMGIPGYRYPGYSKELTINTTPLQAAASSGLKHIVQQLLLKQADVNETDANGRTAVHSAAEKGRHKIVELLLSQQPASAVHEKKDKHGQTALHLAAAQGHEWAAGYLIMEKPKVDEADNFGQTALHLVALNGHERMTALHLAALNGQRAVAQRLLRKANANVEDSDRRTPLHIAAWRGNCELVSALLPNSNVTAKDKDGLTALHWVASQGHKEVVALLQNGADVLATAEGGWTSLHWASARRYDMTKPRTLKLGPDGR